MVSDKIAIFLAINMKIIESYNDAGREKSGMSGMKPAKNSSLSVEMFDLWSSTIARD